MATAEEKRIKNEFRKKAQEKPEVYYPVKVLIEKGFVRKKCKVCGNYFWTLDPEREVCGDPNCIGKYQFIGKKIIEPIEFPDVWKRFSKFLEKYGYTPIERYPVVARWRDDLFFVEASIDDFIPYVLEGISDAPANPLTVPQFCLRFNDIDNVGVTGRHYTGFVMIGQHTFQKPENYKPEEYLEHIYLWLTKELKIPEESLQFHEDAWAGSGKMGPSMEYFSHGLELGNQVYMQFDISTGKIRELPLKVLDMGMGQERYVWFSHGDSTSYESVMPTVVNYLYSQTGVRKTELFNRFIPYSGKLNLDEVADIDQAWSDVAKLMGTDVKTLKEEIYPLIGVYAIAEHTRTLLIALHDGALPSNVGGGYNLRTILRRSFGFIEKFGWDIDIVDLFERHAKYLKPQYPELTENIDELNRIIDYEKKKYEETRKKNKMLLEKLKKEEITEEKMVELYDSYGIHPEEVKEKFGVKIPGNFYQLVTERHKQKEKSKEEIKIDTGGIITKRRYYEDPRKYEFEAKVLKIVDNWVILDETYFYPRGGGQEPDYGFLGESRVIDVEAVRGAILHKVDKVTFKEGDVVKGKIDEERRKRIMRHHTSIHLLNGVCTELFGNHIWQAGSYKDDKKARLDVTHYENFSEEEIEKIEEKCNEYISQNRPVRKFVLPRVEAEKRYGFRIYQGGAIPGNEIRIVEIEGVDIEACGGLHMDNIGEIEKMIILNTTKIQDGVIRIEIASWKAADEYMEKIKQKIEKIMEKVGCKEKGMLIEKIKELKEKREMLEKRLREKEKELVENIEKTVEFEKINGREVLVEEFDLGMKEIMNISRKLTKDGRILILFGRKDGSVLISSLTDISARELMKKVSEEFGGKGGGTEKLTQGKVDSFDKKKVIEWLEKM